MTVNYWLYVSKSKIPAEAVPDILRNAQQKNAELGITGALMFGGGHFGQFLEGPPEALLTLKSAIMADQRHTEIKTIKTGKADLRHFGGWSMVYFGASMVVSRALQYAIRDAAHNTAKAGSELLALMDQLAKEIRAAE